MAITVVDKVALKATVKALLEVLSNGNPSSLDGETLVLKIDDGTYVLASLSGPILGDAIA